MIEFTQDFSDPLVADLLVSKTLAVRYSRMACLIRQIQMALPGLLLGFMWLCDQRFSFLYPIGIFFWLTLALSVKSTQAKACRENVQSVEADESLRLHYMINEDGVRIHKDHADTLMHWTHFISWGIQGRILYLETINHKFIVCHQRQVSAEEFVQLKSLAADHIKCRNKEGA